MCSSCGLCSGPPCLIYDKVPWGAPCPECNPESVTYYDSSGQPRKQSGPCLVLLLAGIMWAGVVAALLVDTLRI